jgi:hypothetical protein
MKLQDQKIPPIMIDNTKQKNDEENGIRFF